MRKQADLFAGDSAGEPIVAGLRSCDDFLERDEEARLIAAIDAAALAPFRFQGWQGKRLTASFGWRYDFDSGAFGRTEPMPDWLLPIRDRAAQFAGLAPADLVQSLVIRYDPEAGIGWHRDRPQFEHVIGISLGAAATMRLRRRVATGRTGFERAALPLSPRSIYHLSGEVRQGWEHSIAPMETTRWSITFRSLSALGLRSAG